MDPEFPRQAYMMFVFMVSEGTMIGVYPLSTIFASPREAAIAVRELVASSAERDITVPEVGILVPVVLDRLLPMKEEYWDNPTQSYGIPERMNVFLPVANQPQMYKLLVTPSHYEKGTWYFSAVLPLLLSAGDDLIEKFMTTSDHPVDTRAKHAAIYLFQSPVSFNWVTGEEQEVEQASVDAKRLN